MFFILFLSIWKAVICSAVLITYEKSTLKNQHRDELT